MLIFGPIRCFLFKLLYEFFWKGIKKCLFIPDREDIYKAKQKIIVQIQLGEPMSLIELLARA